MLRISKLTDYGVILATRMTALTEPLSGRCIAELSGLPGPTVAKILKAMTRAGLVRSTRGASGGYILARPASEISVGEIIEAMEGPISVTECTDTTASPCVREGDCGLHANWTRINDAVRRALCDISLEEMTMGGMHDKPLVQLRCSSCPPECSQNGDSQMGDPATHD